MRLDVYVSGKKSGLLEQVSPSEFEFTYLPGAERISLTMSVRNEPYLAPYLHPVFQVSMPEGALREEIERDLLKRINSSGDMAVLSVIGSNMIGNLSVIPEGQPLTQDDTPCGASSLDSLLKYGNSQDFITHLLNKQATLSGVSGGYLKVLADTVFDQASFPIDRWIVKLPSTTHHGLSINEFFSMLAATYAGINTAKTKLSENGELLLIKRFDVKNIDTDTNERLGFEDMCSLFGLPSGLKFSGSVERIIKTINSFCDATGRKESLEQFFRQYALAMIIRNGDAHLKNFGLLYDNIGSVMLAPCYDMVTMAAYAPLQSNGKTIDIPALTFGGIKRWFRKNDFVRLSGMCGIKNPDYILNDIGKGINQSAFKLIEYANNNTRFADHARKMLLLWSDGLKTSELSVEFDLSLMKCATANKPL